MSRASNRLLCAFIFAVMAFVAINIVYYQLIDKMAENALNEVMPVDTLHSAIPNNDFAKDSLLSYLPRYKDKRLLNWIEQHPDCKISSAYASDKNNWVWAYVISDEKGVVLAIIYKSGDIITSL